jgi:hypothetical protein
MNQRSKDVINFLLDEEIEKDKCELAVAKRFGTMDAEIRQEWEEHLYMCRQAKQNFSKHASFIVGMLNYAITELEDRLRYEHYPTPADKLAATRELIDLETAKNLMLLKKKAVAC